MKRICSVVLVLIISFGLTQSFDFKPKSYYKVVPIEREQNNISAYSGETFKKKFRALKSYPESGTTGVNLSTVIEITFPTYLLSQNEKVFNNKNIKINNKPCYNTVVLGDQLIITPQKSKLKANTKYTLSIVANALTDMDGNKNEFLSFSFKTGEETREPFSVVKTVPEDKSIWAGLQDGIQIIFNQAIYSQPKEENFSHGIFINGIPCYNAEVYGSKLIISPKLGGLEPFANYSIVIKADTVKCINGKGNEEYQFIFSTPEIDRS